MEGHAPGVGTSRLQIRTCRRSVGNKFVLHNFSGQSFCIVPIMILVVFQQH